MLRVLSRLIADTCLIAAVLFGSAGTLSWPRAWMLLGVMFVVRVAGAVAVYRVNPELMRERSKLPVHRDQPLSDKLLLLSVIATGFLGLSVVAGFDVFRWHLLPRPVPYISAVGLILFATGWGLKSLALHANAFAASVVRLQRERRHAVADTGPYRLVRHPFYFGTLLVFVGMSLWLESYAAALFAVVPIAFVVRRLQLEEHFLRRELPGYADYAAGVRHRLVPGIW